MEFKDYYKILGVGEKATTDEVKKAYRKLARLYHPDVSKEVDAEKKFKEVGEAYEVLKDKEKRQEYDQLKAMGARGRDGSFRPPPDWESAGHFYEGGADASGFSDFFASIFGHNGGFHRQHQGPGGKTRFSMRGEDVHHELPVFLEEAYGGCERVLEVRVPEVDEHGLVSHRSRKLKIKVPPGTSDGQVLRIRGQGGPGMGGGGAGDLLTTIRVAAHPLFSLDGRNISLVVPVAPWEAALGSKITIPTLQDKTLVTVPPNSQTGQKLRLKGKGMPGSPPGDFYVVLKVLMPDKSTQKSRELFAELASEIPFNPRAQWEDEQ
ncbi:MAG: DnaJ C-terminal domain-containing protein [Pseudohongiellaceae bacterium]